MERKKEIREQWKDGNMESCKQDQAKIYEWINERDGKVYFEHCQFWFLDNRFPSPTSPYSVLSLQLSNDTNA